MTEGFTKPISELLYEDGPVVSESDLELFPILDGGHSFDYSFRNVQPSSSVLVSVKTSGSFCFHIAGNDSNLLNVSNSLQIRKVNILTIPYKYVRWGRWLN